MKPGDRATLVSGPDLNKAFLGKYAGETVILQKPLTPVEKPISFERQEVWWVDRVNKPTTRWYVPVSCLCLIQETETTINYASPSVNAWTPGNLQTETLQTERKNMLNAVTILKKPSQLQEQAGETESIVVPSTEVVSSEAMAAVAIVAAENAEAILALKNEKAKLRVIVRTLG